MAKTATISINLNAYADGPAVYSNNLQLSNAAAVGTEQTISLTANTDFTLTPPTGATKMVVLSVSAGTLLGKGASGDTGITLAVNSVNTPPAILRNASTSTIVVWWM